jgi:hypothetical protein
MLRLLRLHRPQGATLNFTCGRSGRSGRKERKPAPQVAGCAHCSCEEFNLVSVQESVPKDDPARVLLALIDRAPGIVRDALGDPG